MTASQRSEEDEIDHLVAAAPALLGMTVPAEWQPTVRVELEVTLQHARRVAAFTLPDEAEPAPVFKA